MLISLLQYKIAEAMVEGEVHYISAWVVALDLFGDFLTSACIDSREPHAASVAITFCSIVWYHLLDLSRPRVCKIFRLVILFTVGGAASQLKLISLSSSSSESLRTKNWVGLWHVYRSYQNRNGKTRWLERMVFFRIESLILWNIPYSSQINHLLRHSLLCQQNQCSLWCLEL